MNCQIHPFKQCSFYSKKEDRLQCPLCLLPQELQQQVIDNTTKPLSNNSIIDIDLMESLAQSLLLEEDLHTDLNQLESKYLDMINEFQKSMTTQIELICQNIQKILLQSIYKLRMKAEQQTQEIEENQKLLQKIQDMRKHDQHHCIDSITSLQNSLTKSDKMTQKNVQQLSTNTVKLLDNFIKQSVKHLEQLNITQLENELQLIFDPNTKPTAKANDQFKSVNQSMSSQTGNISVEQIKKICIQNQYSSEYVVNSLVVLDSQIIVGTKCGKLVLYECNTFDQLFTVEQAHKDSIKILARGFNDKVFVSAGVDKFIKIWQKQLDDGVYKIQIKVDLEQQVSQVLCLTVCDNLKISQSKSMNILLVGSVDNTVRIWNLDNGQYFFTYSGHTGDVYSVAFVKKLNVIASGSQDKSIRLWDGLNYKYSRALHKFSGHTDSVVGLVALPEENQVLSCGLDKTIRQWDCEKKVQIKVITTLVILQNLVLFQPGVVVASSSDCKLRIFDYRISTQLHEINNQKKNVVTYCVDQDNKSLLCGNDNHVNLFY